MIRTLVIGAVGAAVLGGTGVGALALSGAPAQAGTPSAVPSSTSAASSSSSGTSAGKASAGKRHDRRALLREVAKRTVQGDIVVKGKDGTFTTVDFARGRATISPTSLSVATPDGHTVSFTLDPATKYHVRADKKTSKGSYASVHDGDTVVVLGKAAAGASGVTATQVLDLGAAK